MLNSPSLRLLLVIALFFTQLGGMAHGISHVLAEQKQDQSLPHESCELCDAYAHFAGAIPGGEVQFDFGLQTGPTATGCIASIPSRFLAAFAARAPPVSA